jgi:uncharacterized protein with HEPN domain
MDIQSDDRIRLLDIADSLREIQAYIGQGTFEDFSKTDNVREAVTEQLLQIGGAAALLSDEFKEQYGDIDWNILTGFQYANFDEQLELDLHPIWSILENDLPYIKDEVLDLALKLEDEEDLSDVTLNEEDLHDVQEERKSKYARTENQEEVDDIHLVDEMVPRNTGPKDSKE